MALYSYQAFTKDGKRVTGTLDALSVAVVREQLVQKGLYPIAIVQATETVGRRWFGGKVTTKDKIMVTKQLAVLIKSGVPLLEAFELLIEQFEGAVRSMLVSIKDLLREGKSLAESLSRYPHVFDTIYVQLVRAGEATGKLEIILDRLTTYLERREEMMRRVRSALTYPLIQLAIVSMVVVVLMTVVVPKMAETLTRMGKELPGTTQFLLGLSAFLTSYYPVLIVGVVGVVALYRYWRSTAQGALTLDRLALRIPILSFFNRIGALVQFSRTLGTLVEGGVNLAESLDIVCNSIDNQVLATSLKQARDKIIKQGKIAQFLKEADMFPPMAIHLIKTGEESGKLDTMLLTVAQNYEAELNEFADGLSTALEPIMIVVMALVVGFVVMAVAQPMMEQVSLAGAGIG